MSGDRSAKALAKHGIEETNLCLNLTMGQQLWRDN
jgi:hypothetical protein